MKSEQNTSSALVPLKRAVSLAGSQAKLGKASGFSQHAIWLALQSGRVSAELAVGIERATDGLVSRKELRPDLFDAASSKLA